MKMMSHMEVAKFKYDSEEERRAHVSQMESQGWKCTGRLKQSDSFESEAYWYGEFYKYNSESKGDEVL